MKALLLFLLLAAPACIQACSGGHELQHACAAGEQDGHQHDEHQDEQDGCMHACCHHHHSCVQILSRSGQPVGGMAREAWVSVLRAPAEPSSDIFHPPV